MSRGVNIMNCFAAHNCLQKKPTQTKWVQKTHESL